MSRRPSLPRLLYIGPEVLPRGVQMIVSLADEAEDGGVTDSEAVFGLLLQPLHHPVVDVMKLSHDEHVLVSTQDFPALFLEAVVGAGHLDRPRQEQQPERRYAGH